MTKKELERELGRYRKRCDDLMEINRALGEKVHGAAAVNLLAEALQIQMALTYGEDALDPDDGTVIGKRLTLPAYDARELVRKHEAHARKDGDRYIIGVGLRNDPADNGK